MPWSSSSSAPTPTPAPGIPAPRPAPQLRQYTDDIEHVRVLYFVTALRTVVVVAYIEV
ncbi:hypothetical protein [Streptomyces sp. RP5T]|uniref:hypothetical protein n=1 Tax=Streptomyces sp. RP5T TaxID=2490848 RepID=UPI00163AB17B|nr:hypothetical protein [Streptomyces sp. RP5T]